MEMEMLQQTMHLKRQPSSGPKICAQEAHGCGGGQGSPLPGDTASSPHSLQHSPSLPICGLTEFSETDSTPWERSSIELQELLAAKEKFSQVCILPLDLAHCRDNPDPALSTGAPQKQYVGVRVRMPVRELLKKLRVSRGMNSKEAKETSVRVATRKNSGTTGKRRACSKNQYKQNRQQTPAALKSVEDLDILVEILQEDLHQSHAKQETQLCEMGHHGGLPEVWPPFEEAESNLQPESSWESVRLQPPCSVSHSELLSHLGSESLYSDCRMKHQYLGSTNMFPNLCMQNNSYQWNDIASYSVERFQSLARDSQTASACLCPPGLIEPMSVEDKATVVLHNEGCLKARPGAIWRQEVSTLSFFQFQLRHEESWLRKIPLEKLFVPDKNGDRLLHKAVRQGKRALAFALAQRFAYRRKIDERDSAKQTALHIAAQKNHHMIFGDLVSLGASVNERDGAQKTPLHLCAQNGFVRILEILKNCWHLGIHVELGAVDSQGWTALQCATLAHSTLVLHLAKPGLSPEMRKALTLRKEQIFAGICCLMQMDADLQDQGSASPTGLDETALLYLQGGDQEFPPAAWSGFLDQFPKGNLRENGCTCPPQSFD